MHLGISPTGSEHSEVSVSSAQGGQQEGGHLCQSGGLHIIQVAYVRQFLHSLITIFPSSERW